MFMQSLFLNVEIVGFGLQVYQLILLRTRTNSETENRSRHLKKILAQQSFPYYVYGIKVKVTMFTVIF